MRNFLLRRQATFDPPRFQGWGRTRNYFEGWYFKLVMPEHHLAYAFIPGVSYAADGTGHAFLQVLDGVGASSAYHRYEVADFLPAEDRFSLRLGPHEFSEQGIKINLADLQLDLNFVAVHPWPKRPLAPGVMGWYGFVPRMQCYHGLVSMHHQLQGHLTVAGLAIAVKHGTGYIEKDWGSGFPDAWVWCQSNHLTGTDQPVSLMASVASIPWLGSSFTGFLATFLLDGEFHLFTTWAGAQVQTEFSNSKAVKLTFATTQKMLVITGHPAAGGNLVSPVTGAAMTGKINESLQAELEVEFWQHEQLVYAGRATWAGLEVSAGARELL
ncbi:MAG: tocopherol cyclase family protein [Bacteroidota bacterium]